MNPQGRISSPELADPNTRVMQKVYHFLEQLLVQLDEDCFRGALQQRRPTRSAHFEQKALGIHDLHLVLY
jgi:hypothetical protein